MLISCSTHARACTQNGEAAKPSTRKDIPDLVQGVITTLVTQGNSQVLYTNPSTNSKECSTSRVMRQTPTITGILSSFLYTSYKGQMYVHMYVTMLGTHYFLLLLAPLVIMLGMQSPSPHLQAPHLHNAQVLGAPAC